MTPQAILDILDAIADDPGYGYGAYALRVVKDLPEVGDTLPPSRRWDDGYLTEDTLGGTSGLGIEETEKSVSRALTLATRYRGSTLLLIRGEFVEEGSDFCEIVLASALVVARWERP